MPLSNISKIFQTSKKWCADEFGLEIHLGEITRRRPKQELTFLHAILLLDLLFVPTKNYIISNGIGDMACTRLQLKKHNYTMK